MVSVQEFFKITPEEAYEIFYDIKELLGDEAELKLHGDNIEVKTDKNNSKRKRSQLFSFYSKGIKDGEIVKFVEDETIVAVVANARQVLFEGGLWYLSSLARELYERQGRGNARDPIRDHCFLLIMGCAYLIY